MPFWHAIFYHFLASFLLHESVKENSHLALPFRVCVFVCIKTIIFESWQMSFSPSLSLHPSTLSCSLRFIYSSFSGYICFIPEVNHCDRIHKTKAFWWNLLEHNNKSNNDLRLSHLQAESFTGVGRQTNKSYRYHAWLNRLKQLKLYVNRGTQESDKKEREREREMKSNKRKFISIWTSWFM
jgi:hypothetical protein